MTRKTTTLTVLGGAAMVIASVLVAGGFLSSVRGDDQVLPDFSQWPAGEVRKSRFFDYLRPLLEAENRRILEQREALRAMRDDLDARSGARLSSRQQRRLAALAEEYAIDEDAELTPRGLVTELLLRVDAVPVSLGLVQAAKESAWGTSRFAAHGNALYGQRCYDPGCGLIPEFRGADETYEVRAFDTPADAVSSYLRNLNTHPDYTELRRMRAELRSSDQPVTGFLLADALTSYSERGNDYIEEVREMIRYNELGPTLPATAAQER